MILLTGATGFLGTEIARRLMEMPEIRISAVVRAADNEEACRRLKAAWHHEAALYKAVGVRILPVAGDFTEAGLGLSDETAKELQERITHVIHAGAEISFQKAKEAYGIANVRGTANMIAFSKTLPRLLYSDEWPLRSMILTAQGGETMNHASTQKTAIVIGTGAGGAMMAKELQGPYKVTILEAGGSFRPFSFNVKNLAKLRKSGLYFDERMIRMLLPNMLVEKSQDMVMVRGIGLGGTTTLATGNAVRCDGALKELGIDLDEPFEELYASLPITTEHRQHWSKATEKMFGLFERMGLEPQVTPKLLRHAAGCIECGHCAIGCPVGVKWDTRELVDQAVAAGAELITGCRVTGLDIAGGVVTGVEARHRGKKETYRADLIVLAAGGFGTPVILENAGIPVSRTLFVDPVLCVAGPLPGIRQDRQILMPFISQQDGCILSPYMDYLSFFFNRDWRMPIQDIASIMIKLADDETGSISARAIDKQMTASDQRRMEEAVLMCREILRHMGVPDDRQFLGTLNAGHPGGMLPLTAREKDSLHSPVLPDNLYVADATILPRSMGNPPILTIMALAKKIAGRIRS